MNEYVPIAINCNSAPVADTLSMLEVDPTPIVSTSGEYWVGMSPKHYENLSINMQNILAHIRQKNAIIEYYQRCIDESVKVTNTREESTK